MLGTDDIRFNHFIQVNTDWAYRWKLLTDNEMSTTWKELDGYGKKYSR